MSIKAIFITCLQIFFAIFMYAMGAIFFGAAMIPGLALLAKAWQASADFVPLLRFFVLGMTIAFGYFLFGLTLVLLVGLFRVVFGFKLKEGNYPIFSPEALKWAFVSSLYLMILYTFIDFLSSSGCHRNLTG